MAHHGDTDPDLPANAAPNPTDPPPAAESLLLIVVGAHPQAELRDRPAAYRLCDHVRRSLRRTPAPQGVPALQPLVISDVWYLNDQSMRERPVISVGGPSVNALSAYLADKLPSALVIDDVLMVQLDVEFAELTACCWGMHADSTAAAVELFRERYLEEFIRAAAGAGG